MPPWGADPAHRQVLERPEPEPGARSTRSSAWVDGGAPEGNRAELPKAPQFAEGWSIGKPDHVFKMIEAVHGAGRRHGAVRLRHDSDQPERRHLDPRHRAEADRSPRRAPHHQRPRRGRRQAGDRRRRLARIGNARRSAASAASCRVVSTDVFEEGVARKIPAGRRHRAADALHDDRPAGDRPAPRSASSSPRSRRTQLRAAAAARCRTPRSPFRPVIRTTR